MVNYFKKNINIGFVTNYIENGKQLINTIFRYIDNLPKEIIPEIITKTNTGFSLKNKVNFYVMNQYEHTLDKSVSYLFVDSFDAFDKLKKYVLPSLKVNIIKNKIKNINKHIIYLL